MSKTNYLNIILLLLLLALIIFGIVYWIDFMTDNPNIEKYECTGVIGDTIGGLTAPIIGGISAILVFYSFQEQLKANNIQRKALEQEHKNTAADQWYQKALIDFNSLNNVLVDYSLVYPIGTVDMYFQYEKTIKYKGLVATTFVQNRLSEYHQLTPYQRLSIDQFIYEYGKYVKQFEILVMETNNKKELYPFQFELVNNIINHTYFGTMKINLTSLILKLNKDNDKKEVFQQLINMQKHLDEIVIPIQFYFNQEQI